MPGRRTPVRTRILATVTMALLAVGVGFSAPAVGSVAAAQCRSGGHVTYLESGAVSPTSGTAGTAFTFSVVFRDNQDRAPYSISVIVDGNPYPMSGPTVGFAQGVTFAATMPIGADNHSYSFTATGRRSNGSAGCTVNLAGGSLIVTAPTPTPTPTPKPTPTPTPKPTPTPQATAKATPKPTPKPAATPAAPSASPAAVPSATPAASSGPSPSPTPAPTPLTAGGAGIGGRGGAGGGGGGEPLPGSSGLPGGEDGLPFPLLMAMVSMTLAGLGLLFLFLVLGRRRRDEEPQLAVAAVETEPLEWAPAAGAGPAWAVAGGDVLPTEAGVPRWRRQSLRETRRRSERDAPTPRMALTFRTPIEPGVERRLVAYSLVRLSSEPDELLGEELGWLDRGDEVEVVQKRGVHWLVRTPDGAVGWIHRTTLESTTLGDGELPDDELPVDGEMVTPTADGSLDAEVRLD